MRMNPQRAYKLGVLPEEVRITVHAGRYGGNWILWIPNNRYPEDDVRFRQILTESHSVHRLCYWKADLQALVAYHGS